MEQITKKKILALYPGQPRIKGNNLTNTTETLMLKSLSNINDKEVYTIWAMCLGKYSDSDNLSLESKKQYILELWKSNRMYQEIFSEITPIDYLKIADFLRGNGYAIPAFGFTVDQLRVAGVIKIIDDTVTSTQQLNNMSRPSVQKHSDEFRIIDTGAIKVGSHLDDFEFLLKSNKL